MFKGRIIPNTAAVANTNIPFAVVWNTNNNTRYNQTANTVEIGTVGYYDVNVMLTVTGVATSPITATLLGDSTPILESVATTDITATTGVETLVIVDTVRVSAEALNSVANLSVQLNEAATVTSGLITVEKVR